MSSRTKALHKWKKCSCGTIFHKDDVDIHAPLHCPPIHLDNNWTYGHIFQNKFYSFIKEFEPSSTDKNSHFYNEIVQVSLSVIQLCKFVIGDPVVIRTKNGHSIVKCIWPLSNNILSSVFVTKLGMEELNYFEGPVIIEYLESNPLPIKTIVVKLKDPSVLDEYVINDMLVTANIKLQNKIVTTNQNITFVYYGLQPVFTVINIIPYCNQLDDVSNLSDEITQLDIDERKFKQQFFTIISSTTWSVANISIINDEPVDSNLLSKVGGIGSIITELRNILETVTSDSSLPGNLKKPNGVILYGISGTGKTLVSRAFCKDSNFSVIEISSWDIFGKYYGQAESKLKAIFTDAVNKSPSIIFIDELDILCSNKSTTDQEQRVMVTLLTMLDHLQGEKVLVLATTRHLDEIDSAFRRPGRFDYEIEIPVPTAEARIDILHCLLKEYNHVLTEDEISVIGTSAHGFVGSDLSLLCTQASTKSVVDHRGESLNTVPLITKAHMNWSLSVVKPSAMREVLVEVPNVKWSDIGGEEDLKLQLQQVLEWPLRHPEAFSRLGITPSRGVLLFGPPGCSKTMIAKAVATESNLNFISIKGAELYSKWVGESEKAVRKVFQRARTVAPCIIFFDEIDSLAGKRGTDESTGGTSVQERVLSQLLTELDGIESLSAVTIVAATNRPDRIDSALLRPGRLDRKLYVPLPNTNTRAAILRLQFCKTPVDEDVLVDELVSLTDGYSGAELVSVCYEAAMKSLQEDLKASIVNRNHFIHALKTVKPKTPQNLINIYNEFNQDYSVYLVQ